jgi:HEAT repeat protein
MLALLLPLALVASLFFVQHSAVNVMHPALDELAAVKHAERRSHPQMLKIRALGAAAVPELRRVLREKNNPSVRFLLWVKTKWPGATKYYSRFPDPKKMSERRWVACQVLETLGPAGRAATPELIEILKGTDASDLNAATSALFAVGIDAAVCEQLNEVMEQGLSWWAARMVVIGALARVKPPSERTLKVVTASLAAAEHQVQQQAAQSLGEFGVSTPGIVSALKNLQATTSNNLALVRASVALWELQMDSSLVVTQVFRVLAMELDQFTKSRYAGLGGQVVDENEQVFMQCGALFQRMNLSERERAMALGMLESFCEKSGRIFIRMHLLPAMLDLGFPPDKGLIVCNYGLNAQEIYYQIQAAQLLTKLGEKHSLEGAALDALLRDRDVNVRIHAAKAHWRKHRQAGIVVPVLIESLDRSKYESYYYSFSQPVALSVLGEIGPEAKNAMAPLEKLLRDPNPEVVKQAAAALKQIAK